MEKGNRIRSPCSGVQGPSSPEAMLVQLPPPREKNSWKLCSKGWKRRDPGLGARTEPGNRLRRLRSRAPAAPGGAEHLARGRGTAPGDATETCAWTRNYKGDLYSAVCFSILITSGSIKSTS
ncbi:hypothetical protein CapIbe_023116 [Capra ibex]